jgi:hypothetical protein
MALGEMNLSRTCFQKVDLQRDEALFAFGQPCPTVDTMVVSSQGTETNCSLEILALAAHTLAWSLQTLPRLCIFF